MTQKTTMMIKSSVLLFLSFTSVTAFAPTQPVARLQQQSPATKLQALPDSLDISGAADAVADSVASGAMGGIDTPILAAGAVGLLVIAALAANAGGGSEAPAKEDVPEPEPEPIDISIPYNAAAELAYCQYKGVKSIKDKADFEAFKILYEEETVAEVTLKKMKRDVALKEAEVAAKQKALDATKA